ncbi:MAG: hypothetical protein CMI24_02935 [Opitutae bacterium]|nr:hypothetical protein [Opitutae bacterium]
MSYTTEYKLSDVEISLLEEIRDHAKKMRSLPRIDIFKACDLVQIDVELITPEILSVFMRSLSQAFGRPVNFSEAGARSLTWDEKWLVSVVSAVSRADYDSVNFLIKSAVQPVHQEQCRSLVSRF